MIYDHLILNYSNYTYSASGTTSFPRIVPKMMNKMAH